MHVMFEVKQAVGPRRPAGCGDWCWWLGACQENVKS